MKKTIVDVFEASVQQYPNNTFLMEKVGTQWHNSSYADIRDQVYALGAGLQALGVQPGDHLALLSEGRNLWIVSELAMFYAGAINVPLSVKLEESNDLLFRLSHGDVHEVVVSGLQLEKVRKVRHQLPLLRHVIVLDAQAHYEEGEIFVDNLWKSRAWSVSSLWDVRSPTTQ